MKTYTLAAQRVTFLPSFKHSISPRPLASSLHFIKSSLYALHRSPMKYAALISGADVAPISSTLGMWSGIGVVSTRTCWLNLSRDGSVSTPSRSTRAWGWGVPRISLRHGCYGWVVFERLGSQGEVQLAI